ncbi:MAG: Ig-like domain-containing protein [Oceanococcus sp.]
MTTIKAGLASVVLASISALTWASPSPLIEGDTANVWVYPNGGGQPRSFNIGEWAIAATQSGNSVELKHGSDDPNTANSTNFSVQPFNMLLINAGDGSLPSTVLHGPAFSLMGLQAAQAIGGGENPSAQINPRGGELQGTSRLTVRALAGQTAGQPDMSSLEIFLRTLQGAAADSQGVSSNLADYQLLAQGSPSAATLEFSAETLLTLKNDYRIDVLVRQSGRVSQVLSQRYTVVGKDFHQRDADGDGIPDHIEIELGLDFSQAGFRFDGDQDGWPDLDELIRGTDPDVAGSFPEDSDGDGWSDYDEIEFRDTDPNDVDPNPPPVNDPLGKPAAPVPREFGSEPTAERLYEVEYRVAGELFTDDAQSPALNLTDLSAVDIYGRVRFEQQALPESRGFSLKVLLEDEIAPWQRRRLYSQALAQGRLPTLNGLNVWRLGAGLPLMVRAQQADVNDPLKRGPRVLLAWLPSVADPTPLASGCESSADGAAWLTCYRLYLKGHLLVDLEDTDALKVSPSSSAHIGFLTGLLDWMQQPLDSLLLPGNPDTGFDAQLSHKLLAAMPAGAESIRWSRLYQRLQVLAEPLGALSGLKQRFSQAMARPDLILLDDPIPTTEHQLFKVMRGATPEEIFALRMALITPDELYINANFDPNSDPDGDGVLGLAELENSQGFSQPELADSDGDGWADQVDLCPADADNRCLVASSADSDGDGVADGLDNCPNTPNGDQADTRSHAQLNGGRGNDGIGDACSSALAAAIVQPGTKISVAAGVPVDFMAVAGESFSSALNQISFDWSFGAGLANKQGQAVRQRFTNAGLYTVTMTASDAQTIANDSVSIEVIGSLQPSVQVLIDDAIVAENATVAQLNVRLSQVTTQDVQLQLATADETAQSGSDYDQASPQVTISAGQLAATVDIAIIDDDTPESAESLLVNLVSISGPAVIGRDAARITINDDDTQNSPPVAVADSHSLDEDDNAVSIDVLANDSDPNGDALVLNGLGPLSDPVAGSVSIVNNQLEYAAAPNYFGQFSVAYTVADAKGGSDIGTLTVTVNAQADDPTAAADAFTVKEDSGFTTLAVLENDNDVDGDTLTVILVENVDPASVGTFSISNGALRFRTSSNEIGNAAADYIVDDGTGRTARARVTVTVSEVNDAPYFIPGPSVCTPAGNSPVTMPGWATNIRPGAIGYETDQVLSFELSSLDQPLLFEVEPSLSVNGDLSFTPAAGAQGIAKFKMRLTDDGGRENGGRDSYEFFDNKIIHISENTGVGGSFCLNLLDTSKGAILAGDPDDPIYTNGRQVGRVVRAAGDVNGDGFGDVIAGGSVNGASGGDEAARIWLGRASPALQTLTTELKGDIGYVIGPLRNNGDGGIAVDGLGDINGDGDVDFAVAATGENDDKGSVYVVYGGAANLAALDKNEDGQLAVSDINETSGLKIKGRADSTEDQFGGDVRGIGDVNGDNVPDFAITARVLSGFISKAYVIYGGAAKLTALDVADGTTDGVASIENLGVEHGFVIDGELAFGRTGDDFHVLHLAPLGDFNGDNIDDFALAMPYAERSDDPDRSYRGRILVVFGKDTASDGEFPVVNAQYFDGANGFIIDGIASGSVLGQSTNGGHDLNGDGINDLVTRSHGESSIFVIYGRSVDTTPNGFDAPQGVFDLNSLNKNTGLKINSSAYIIRMVTMIGDRNGDEAAELLIGDSDASNSVRDKYAGAVRVIFGGDSLAALDAEDGVVDGQIRVGVPSASQGSVIYGEHSSDRITADPRSVDSIGDFNNDGNPDFTLGGYRAYVNGSFGNGKLYILFGQ